MNIHVESWIEALVELACPAEVDSNRDRVRGALTQEHGRGVRSSRLGRLLRAQPQDPATKWLLRFAVGRAMAAAYGDPSGRSFTVHDVFRAVEDPLVSRTQLFARATSMTEGVGPLRSIKEDFMLLPGLDAWLAGGPAPMSDVALPNLSAHKEVTRSKVETLAGRGLRDEPTLVRCDDSIYGIAVVSELAARRGRGVRVFTVDDIDEDYVYGLRAALISASVDRCDVFVRMPCLQYVDGTSVTRTLRQRWEGVTVYVQPQPSDLTALELMGFGQAIDLEPDPTSATGDSALPFGGQVCMAQWGVTDAAERDSINTLFAHDEPRRRRGRESHVDEDRWEQSPTTLDRVVLNDETAASIAGVLARASAGVRCVTLLHGPPGTGKSMLARCLAGSLGRPFYALDGGSLRGMYYGEMERRLDEILRAVTKRGAVLIIDEADSFLGRRVGSNAIEGGAHITEVSEFLTQFDRFKGVAVMTTNRAEVLDPAVVRRVDHWISVPLPGPTERMALWASAAPDDSLSPSTLMVLAAIPLAGGDIEAAVREAAAHGGTAAAMVAAARRRSELRGFME